MKQIISIILFIVSNLVLGQNKILIIECLGETITKSDEIISKNENTGTIFKINNNEKSIEVISSSRYNRTSDTFIILDTFTSPFAIAYSCYKTEDDTNYQILVKDNSVGIVLKDGVLIESRIISKTEKEIDIDYYIHHENWEELNKEVILANLKPNSKITAVYEKDESNSLDIIELKDGKLYFRFDLYNGRNLGQLGGIIDNRKNVIFERDDFGLCKIVFSFKTNQIIIKTLDGGYECGYGNGVISDGIFNIKTDQTPKIWRE